MPQSKKFTKRELIAYIIDLSEQKLKLAQAHRQDTHESVLSEDKGSAGDKHETGRAMAQIELDKAGNVVVEQEKVLAIFKRLQEISSQSNQIALGSLIELNDFYIFLSSGLGLITFRNTQIYVVGPHAPLGQQILGKKIDDSILLNGISHKIICLS